jgi:Glyoxalase-like domain
MPQAPLVFDHLTLNARDELDPCCAALEAMGFVLTSPSYSNIGAVNRCIVLEGAYLEAIAINPRAIPPRRELMQQPLGLNAIVFRAENADACYADFMERGFPVLPVQPFSRRAENSLGEDREVSFRVVRFESSWAAEAFPFGRVYFCEHLNPEVIFDQGYVRHGNGCRAFSALTIEVKNLAKLSLTMHSIFGSAWTGDSSQATLRTQALDIRFVHSSADRIATCGFTSRACISEASTLSDPKQALALNPPIPQVFENSYGRFSLQV